MRALTPLRDAVADIPELGGDVGGVKSEKNPP